jgi:exopolysaccharide biosynthesis polyprenyl glycosylphosphotransferase
VTTEATAAPLQDTVLGGSRPYAPSLTPLREVVRAANRGFLGATLLRFGIAPYLLLVDVLALAAGVSLAAGLTGGLLVFCLATIWFNSGAALYRSRLTLSILDQAPDIAVRALAAAAVASAVGLVVGAGDAVAPLFTAAGGYVGAAVVLRATVFTAVRAARRHGLIEHPTLVLGAGHVGRQIVSALVEHPEYGLRPIGFLDSDPLLSDDERPAPLLGGTESLADVILETGARDVVIAFSSQPSSAMVDIIRTCDRLRCELFIVPRLFELHDRSGHDVEAVWGMPLLRMREAPFRRVSWRLKRVVDVAVAGLSLVALSPVFLACALGVRREGGPGVLFRQTRVGLDGRAFELLKFRSMRPVDNAESATLWSIADDDRIGPIGRLLRASSLDELPQLWNVLVGDMSLVGPRPYLEREIPEMDQKEAIILRVKPGITGIWQVTERNASTFERRLHMDVEYVRSWSPWLDIYVLARTIPVVLGGTGS